MRGPRHGQGRVTYSDGRTLKGECRAGMIYNGRGMLVHTDGIVGEGQWLHGELTGQCKETYYNSCTLEGSSEGGMYHCKGVRLSTTGLKMKVSGWRAS
jgi:hypothetical protein